MNVKKEVFRNYVEIVRRSSFKRANRTQIAIIMSIFKGYNREKRIEALSNLCGRKLDSANDLWEGEARAIIEESTSGGFWDLCQKD